MRVKSIHLRNFKRFSDLIIRDIPESARVVVVVGPNGCGKSSLFEAFLTWYRLKANFGYRQDDQYYAKVQGTQFQYDNAVTVSLHGDEVPSRDSLYIRSAYRNDPDFSVTSLSRQRVPTESVRLQRLIDNDQTVSTNYHRLVHETISMVYDTGNDSKLVGDLRNELIGAIRSSMQAVFGDVLLCNVSDPLGDGSFQFEKGTSAAYHYKNLSGGEKAAFDLLLDMHLNRRFYPNALYCIDEIDTHLHTQVQGRLFRELVHILPEKSQLWTTTHSLGVIRAAQELAATDPQAVAIIDFHGVDFDEPFELTPATLGKVSIEKMLSITLDDLSTRIAPKVAVVCEGSSVGTRRRDFDARVYNKVLGTHFPDVVFVSGGGCGEVAKTGAELKRVLETLLPDTRLVVLRDRDDLSEDEVVRLRKDKTLVLSRRNIESFLLDDEVLQALAEGQENPGAARDKVLEIKRRAMKDSTINRGNPPDDLKSAAGVIYTELKKELALSQCGNDANAFLLTTLAPLIVESMACFEELKKTIILPLLAAGGTDNG